MLLSVHLSAQKELIATATDFIASRKYSEANAFLDSVLKQNKNNVDALMMKGNVILNAALDSCFAGPTVTPDDESVFYVSEKPKKKFMDNEQTVRDVEKIWFKCLLLDTTRTDIRKGLCALYAMSLQYDSLEKSMLLLKKYLPGGDEEVFTLAEYARQIKEVGDFDGAMRIYMYLVNLYPGSAGIRADVASEYFYNGDFKSSFQWLDSCYRYKSIDETSLLNGAFVLSQLSYFSDALTWLERYDSAYHTQMSLFYKGMMSFAELGDVKELSAFVNKTDSNSYYQEHVLARDIISLNTRDTSWAAFQQLLNRDYSEYYKPFLYIVAMKKYGQLCDPYVSCGLYQSKIKNYSAAVNFLAEGQNCRMPATQRDYWMLHYAYTLYMSGFKEKAMTYFGPLKNSSDNFVQQASAYFQAVYEADKLNFSKATDLFFKLWNSTAQTKYTALAYRKWLQLSSGMFQK